MASLGIGLGAFVDGLARGVELRGRMDDRATAAEERERRRKLEEQQLAEHNEDRAYQMRLRNEAESDKAALRAINEDARSTFDRGVAAGSYDPAEFDKFWEEYAMPKLATELLEQGKYEQADALQDWADSRAAKKGGRLFASAMFKANAGDLNGALDDALEAGRTKGYIDSDFKFTGKEEIVDQTGRVLGYRITMEDGEGNSHVQDVAVDDVPQFISTMVNPEAAWASQQAAMAAQAKSTAELEDFKAKETIKADIADRDAPAKARSAAIKSLRDRSAEEATLNPNAVAFDELPADQQEQLIQQELALQTGPSQPVVPTPNIIVDGRTGQPVGAAPSGGSAKGLGAVPSPPVASTRQPAVDAGLALPTEEQMLTNAANALVRGDDPQAVARMLQQTGIDPAKWPRELQGGV